MSQGEGTNSSFAMSRLNSLCCADSEDARARFAAKTSFHDSWPNIWLLTTPNRQERWKKW